MLPLSIFIITPTLKSLWQRLENRGSDTLEQRWTRFTNGYNEILQAKEYEYIIVNNELEEAYQKLRSIIVDQNPEKSDHYSQREDLCKQLTDEFNHAPWIKELREQLVDEASSQKNGHFA